MSHELVLEVEWGTKIYGKGTVATGKIICDKVKIGEIVRFEDAFGDVVQETNTRTERVESSALPESPIAYFFNWLFGQEFVRKKPVLVEKTYPLRIMGIETFVKSHEAKQGDDVALLFWGLTFTPVKGMKITREKNFSVERNLIPPEEKHGR